MTDILALCYHAISEDWLSPLAVTPDNFERQLTTLVRRGYRGARFGEATDGAPGAKRILVTFDDGYRSVRDIALPILDSLGLPATVFVPTAFVSRGEPASWSGMERDLRGPHAHELRLMTWEELADLQDRGWEIGSHSQNHPHLTEIGDEQLAEELLGSKRVCEERLGVPCRSLAYPYGEVDTRVMAAAGNAGYILAAGLPARRFHAPLAMDWPRVGVYGTDRRWRFELETASLGRRIRSFAITATPKALPGRARRPAALQRKSPSPDARVAVIIPCFNDRDLVLQAVNSISEAEPVEVVVVDDASTDPRTLSVLDVIRSLGVPVLRHEENRGLSAARMTGLAATRAPYVFPLDADDLAVPGALTAMADRLDANPGAAVCFGDYAEFGTRELIHRVPSRLDAYRIAYRNEYPVSSLFRRSVLESVGGWQAVGDEIGYEDWNLWMTLAERGEVGIHWGRGVAVMRRLHGHRMLTDATKKHITLYATLRTLHPRLFGDLAEHRSRTDLGPLGKLVYPLVFGWRPPLSVWSRVGPIISSLRSG